MPTATNRPNIYIYIHTDKTGQANQPAFDIILYMYTHTWVWKKSNIKNIMYKIYAFNHLFYFAHTLTHTHSKYMLMHFIILFIFCFISTLRQGVWSAVWCFEPEKRTHTVSWRDRTFIVMHTNIYTYIITYKFVASFFLFCSNN